LATTKDVSSLDSFKFAEIEASFSRAIPPRAERVISRHTSKLPAVKAVRFMPTGEAYGT
jgi:hypothetical protein